MNNVSKLFFLGLLAGGVAITGCSKDDDDTMTDEEKVAQLTTEKTPAWQATFAANSNKAEDQSATFGVSDIIPTGTAATAGATLPNDGFFTPTSYAGAFDPNGTAWYAGWSSYENAMAGTLKAKDVTTQVGSTVVTVSGEASGRVEWTNDNTYKLDGFYVVGAGDTLVIEAGTVIQALATPTNNDNASALVVARGGYIMAEGTASQPIVFTAENAFNGDFTTRGQWGGVIILGNAKLNSQPGSTQIEGISTDKAFGEYGGTDNADNSGIFRYVSIRHGGSDIGAGNEINGLTLGGVGSGTTIEYVEILANKDDGIEWFGGVAQIKHAVVLFCGDDSFDYDEGFDGKLQYAIIHQGSDDADRGGEHDGGTSPETAQPYATPQFANVTSIGNSSSRAITFRDNAGGEYWNSIFHGYGKGVDIEYRDDLTEDSYARFEAGELQLKNCVFSKNGAGTTAEDLFKVSVQL